MDRPKGSQADAHVVDMLAQNILWDSPYSGRGAVTACELDT
jgi:hypothetical protein